MACHTKQPRQRKSGFAAHLASEWNRAYSEMVSYVRQHLSLAIVSSNTMLLRDERAPTWRRRGAENGVAAGTTQRTHND
eukprot:CCRYP_017815-RA/>CCRYP_017815-RA protein AED:0.46 eAED:0.46 QI:0/-1/0/1/-1/0/1/0/78